MNVLIRVSDDGGKTLRNLGEKYKHVDNHTIWIDPKNPNYYRGGCDGGVYETADKGANWRVISHLPVTQCYGVAGDDAAAFSRVSGGNQVTFEVGRPGLCSSAR